MNGGRNGMVWLPEKFLERMKEMLGEEYEEFLQSYEQPRTFGLRVNTRKISPEAFEKLKLFPVKQIPWVENGFFYEGDVRPSGHPLYAAGVYYLQEPSAMTPAACLGVQPGERVLDLCAAPGGKATELGARLKGNGVLVANDISTSRARALLYNLEVFGIGNAFVTNETPARLADAFEGFFDRILVDAPCSGEGMFRKEEAVARDWTPEKTLSCAQQQREILTQAVRMLRAGGTLLYSTCTFAPCEDEQTVSWLVEQFPEMYLVPMAEYEGFEHGNPDWGNGRPELKFCVRIWPHRMNGEGHFLALLKKEETKQESESKENGTWDGNETEIIEKRGRQGKGKKAGKQGRKGAGRMEKKQDTSLSPEEAALIGEFLSPCTVNFPSERMERRGQKVYLVPELPKEVNGLKFLRNGLYLGELCKNRFEPSQQLAMYLKAEEYSERICLDLEDERIQRYLRGETLRIDPKDVDKGRDSGWKLVCAGEYPLGWGRLVQGVLKNKYQSSWRKN